MLLRTLYVAIDTCLCASPSSSSSSSIAIGRSDTDISLLYLNTLVLVQMLILDIARFTYFLVALSDLGVILLHGLLAMETIFREAVNDYTYETSVSSEAGVILHLRVNM